MDIKRFLPEQLDWYIRKQHETYIPYSTKKIRKLQPQGQSAQWINLRTGN